MTSDDEDSEFALYGLTAVVPTVWYIALVFHLFPLSHDQMKWWELPYAVTVVFSGIVVWVLCAATLNWLFDECIPKTWKVITSANNGGAENV